jgi:putative drug exporter of the RND superfamily
MFEAIARFNIRFRWLIVAVWVIGVVAGIRLLPSLAEVTKTSNSQFLPANASSQHAAGLAAPFQGHNAGATAVIVAARPDGPLTAADNAAVDRVERAVAQVNGVLRVQDQGASADGRARKALVVTDPATEPDPGQNPPLISASRDTFGTLGAPAGLVLHLTGPLAQSTDAATASAQTGSNIRKFTVLFVIVLLFLVYRALLAPLITLAPAVLSLLLAGPLIAQAGKAGMPVSTATQQLLVVLLLGAGTDYGLFLVFRIREQIRRGATPRDALVAAMGRVGASVTFSALTVIAALACLALASFQLYRGLGPALALGLAVMLAAALTLLPALLAIAGRTVFWPTSPAAGQQTTAAWGRVAARIVRHPVPVLVAGVALFGALAGGLAGYTTGGFTNATTPAGTDSAAGTATIAAHFPTASNPDSLLLHFANPVWQHPGSLQTAQQLLAGASDLHTVAGPLNPNGVPLSAVDLASLHTRLGPAQTLPATPPAGTPVPARVYQTYRATAQFISPDGHTVQFSALPTAGTPGSRTAIASIPGMRTALDAAGRAAGADDTGIAGQDAVSYDIGHYSTTDLYMVVPLVLAVIGILLAVLLRSLTAPIYLVATVGLSYLAALGFAAIAFTHLGHDDGVLFLIPILLFVFAMALGSDYNILLMSRIREEAHTHPLRHALTRAITHTGGTITSAGLILAGTFTVLAIAGNNAQARQLGYTIAFAVILDTFFVRTLLVPSAAVLLGRYNWWPSTLSRTRAAMIGADAADNAGDPIHPATPAGTP